MGTSFTNVTKKLEQNVETGLSPSLVLSICNRAGAATQLVVTLQSGGRSTRRHVPNPLPFTPHLTTHIDLVHGTLEAINNSHRLSPAKGCRQFLVYNKCN